jgi:hypothetical protein
LYWIGSRLYDPYLNRWTSPDSDVPESQGVQGFDRYAYANNNPLRYSDPSGHSIWDTIGQFATGFVYEFARTTAWYSPHAQNVLSVNATESDAMLAGRVAADIATIAVGVAEVTGGIAMGTAGTAVSCAATLCTAAVVTVGAGAVAVGAGATTALAGAAGLGGNLAQLAGNSSSSSSNSSGSINIDPRNLQHEYSSHAGDFGITGNWSKKNGQSFQQAILDHINGKDTQVIQGTYRGNISGTHYYNPKNNLWVFVDSNGTYRAGWKLSLEQQKYLLSNGNIR